MGVVTEINAVPVNDLQMVAGIASGSTVLDDPVIGQLRAHIGENDHVIVFTGFSGLGYEDMARVEHALNNILDGAKNRFGAQNVVVVAGATEEGIGFVYSKSKDFDSQFRTLGIVSTAASPDSFATHCDNVVVVDDPKQTWQVLDPNGNSYMVHASQQGATGECVAFGGGAVTQSEILEAQKAGFNTFVFHEMEPNRAMVNVRREKIPPEARVNFDPSPVRTAILNGQLQRSTGVLSFSNDPEAPALLLSDLDNASLSEAVNIHKKLADSQPL